MTKSRPFQATTACECIAFRFVLPTKECILQSNPAESFFQFVQSYPVLAICTSICALVLTAISSFACWFITVDLTSRDDGNNPLLPPGWTDTKYSDFGFDLWARETTSLGYNYCVLYSASEKSYVFDAYWKAGRAFGMICAMLAVMALTATALHACMREPIVNRNLFPCHCIVAAMQALAFLADGSDICNTVDCEFGPGSTYGIVAAVLFVLTGFFHFLIYKQEQCKMESEDAGVKGEAGGAPQDAAEEANDETKAEEEP